MNDTALPTLFEQRGEAIMAVHDAIAGLKRARTASASELDGLLSRLEQADEMALNSRLYRAFDYEDPLVEATHEVVRKLLPLADTLIDLEGGIDAAPKAGQQQEVSGINLRWMAFHILENKHLPIDKISRWLGFMQGVLAVRGLLSVKKERDATRSIFHRAYKAMGFALPKSASRDGS